MAAAPSLERHHSEVAGRRSSQRETGVQGGEVVLAFRFTVIGRVINNAELNSELSPSLSGAEHLSLVAPWIPSQDA